MTERRLVVLYGSQTGTAEEFAGRLAKEGARYGLKGIVADPEEENMEDLQQMTELDSELGPCIAVFMMATYGEGVPLHHTTNQSVTQSKRLAPPRASKTQRSIQTSQATMDERPEV